VVLDHLLLEVALPQGVAERDVLEAALPLGVAKRLLEDISGAGGCLVVVGKSRSRSWQQRSIFGLVVDRRAVVRALAPPVEVQLHIEHGISWGS
jgi:hypothetical protein